MYKIVDYDPTRSDGKYFLVAWADADEDSKAYPDSWEPTKFVGKELRDAFFSDKQEASCTPRSANSCTVRDGVLEIAPRGAPA